MACGLWVITPLSSLNLEFAAGGVILWVHEGDFGETAALNPYMSDLPELYEVWRTRRDWSVLAAHPQAVDNQAACG